jgi:MFS family permease
VEERARRSQVAFWTVAAVLFALLAAASAPSPLYAVYQVRFGFSALTLTLVFALYVLVLLVTLIVAGSLSDQAGRRPVLVVALLVQIAGMLAFALAEDVGWLFVARALQGCATGLGTGALSATLIDLAPSDRPARGALVSAAVPSVALAVGAVGSGVLIEYGPYPEHLIFWVLIGAYALSVLGVLGLPETVSPRTRLLRAVRPQLGVPPGARPLFVALAPSLLSAWALAGLYMSLGPSVVSSVLGTSSHLAGALLIATLTGAGAVSLVLFRNVGPRAELGVGTAALVLGVAITLGGFLARSGVLVYAGSAVAGLGFGPLFAGAFRSLTALAPPSSRAALIAAIYTISYTGFGVPAIAAGLAVTEGVGLREAANAYGVVVIVLALCTAVATTRRRPPDVAPA